MGISLADKWAREQEDRIAKARTDRFLKDHRERVQRAQVADTMQEIIIRDRMEDDAEQRAIAERVMANMAVEQAVRQQRQVAEQQVQEAIEETRGDVG